MGARARRRLGAPALCAAALLACLVQLVAFSGATAATRGTRTEAASKSKSSKTGGCGDTVTHGSSTLHLRVDGRERLVAMFVPVGYTGKSQVPLVLNLHGNKSTAIDEEAVSGMDTEADEKDFIVAYPQALIPSGSGFDWNVPGAALPPGTATPAHPPDDLAFLTQLPAILESRYCIGLRNVFLSGFSGGARMASQLACNDSNIFAAVAAVSGLRWPSSCPAIRPIPVISFHGTADRVDPYMGHGPPYWTYSVPQAAADWASQDGCGSKPVVLTPASGTRLTQYLHCGARVTVELYSVLGEGHEWPGGPHLPASVTAKLGPQSNALDADGLIWAFFVAHKLP